MTNILKIINRKYQCTAYCKGYLGASQVAQLVKNPPANAEDKGDAGSSPGSRISVEKGMIPEPTSVSLPGEFHGQRSLVGYIPWGQTRLRVRYN